MLTTVLKWLMAGFFAVAGIMHFVFPQFYLQLMPPYLPWHRPLVFLSGVAELGLGLLLLVPRLQRFAAWGIIALLIAVFPANLYFATSNVPLHDVPSWMAQPSAMGRWLRLPFQLVFIAWAYALTRPARARLGASSR